MIAHAQAVQPARAPPVQRPAIARGPTKAGGLLPSAAGVAQLPPLDRAVNSQSPPLSLSSQSPQQSPLVEAGQRAQQAVDSVETAEASLRSQSDTVQPAAAASTQQSAVVPAKFGDVRPKQQLTKTKKKKQKAEKVLPARKDEDVLRWYSEAVQGAERAHRSWPGKRSLPTFGRRLRVPLEEWMAPQLDNIGFEDRPFPQLLPLDVLLQSSGAGSSSSSSSSGSDAQEPAGEAVGPEAFTTSHSFADWARSCGGRLPVLASQWHAPGDSWDLHSPATLLHESHAGHEAMWTAEEHAQAMASLYAEFARDVAALPVVVGRRPASGRLPGAAASFTVDAMVGGGAALQVAQSHNLADNYSRALGVPYSGSSSEEEGEEQADFLSQMGSGLRASLLGAVALVHGDDAGLVLPPSLAPWQVVITPILTRACDSKLLAAEAERIRAALAEAGVRVAVDGRRLKPAARFRASEQLGVPLRLELGPADVAPGTCVLARRTVPGRAGKLRGVSTEAGALAAAVLDLLGDMQTEACGNAAEALQTGIVDVSSFYELREVIEGGMWARAPWAGSIEDEAAVLEETGASLRCVPLAQPVSMWSGYSTCVYSGYQASEVAIFARAL